jgi:hercynylcysteine S-oxide lyase
MNITSIFGRILLNLFYLDKLYHNVNHGSFGSPPREVITKYREYQEQMDFNPEKFIRFTLNEKINETRKIVSEYINAELDNLVLIENASDGINAVFKSLLVNPGEKILIFDISYTSVKNTAKYLKENRGIEIVEIILSEECLNNYEKLLNHIESIVLKNLPIKLASVDHISSVPALILPVKKIISLLRKYNIPVFIDGAHVVGQIPLDIKDINPDFYISNFYKWAFAPKSVSFLYVKKDFQHLIHPNIISSYYGKGFVWEFAFTGSKDYSAYLCIKDALEFRKKIGEDEIIYYNRNLAWQAGQEIAKVWGTEILIKDKMKTPAMVNVRVPCDDPDLIEKIVKEALFEYNTYIPCFKFNNGKIYARFSAQIYNEISDYLYAANIFKKLFLRERKGKGDVNLCGYNLNPKF